MKYKVGDRAYVEYVFMGAKGLGTIKEIRDCNYSFEFDYPISGGHTCGGATKDGCGLYITDEDIINLVSAAPTPMEIVNEYHEAKEPDNPFKQQVGGGHYKSMAIQPVEFILANDLGFCEGNIVKYTCRYKQKGGIQDLKKVIHYAELLIADLEKEGAEF